MTPTCLAGCGRPTTGAGLCRYCTEDLINDLTDLAAGPATPTGRMPGLLADLDDVVLRMTKTGGASVGVLSRSAESGVPYHAAASALMGQAGMALAYWAADLAALHPHLEVPVGAIEVAGWLSRYPALLAGHPEVAALHREITGLTDRVRRMVDRSPALAFLGPCGSLTDDGEVCRTGLYVLPDRDFVRCRACKTQFDVRVRREELLAAVADQLATGPEIARALSTWGLTVTVHAIRQWVHRGKLMPKPPHPLDARRTPRYRVGDVIDRVAKRMVVTHEAEVTLAQRIGTDQRRGGRG